MYRYTDMVKHLYMGWSKILKYFRPKQMKTKSKSSNQYQIYPYHTGETKYALLIISTTNKFKHTAIGK